MQICIIAPGSRGDVQPYLALGKGLQDAGHSVRFVTHENFAGLVTATGLECWPVAGDAQAAAESAEMRAQVERGNFLLILRKMANQAQNVSIEFMRTGLEACQGADALLAGIGGQFIGLALAEKLNLPFIPAYIFPFTPTGQFASVLMAQTPAWFGPAMNRFSHRMTQQVMWQSFRQGDALARRQVLGIPPAPLTGPFKSAQMRGAPVLYGFSPSFLPPPSDWGPEVHVTGFWFSDPGADWFPPPELSAFLDAGPAPVYIGFGSMSNRDPQQTGALVLDAVWQSRQRAVLLSGWSGIQAASLPDNVFLLDSVPHAWLFLRTAAVVHHGGAGTTAAGLRAGVPSIVIPFFGDQPFWGQRIADAGVGPQPIPRKQLTAARLADAIRLAVSDAAMRNRAAEMGARIRAEDGLACAAEVIAGFEKSRRGTV